MAEQTLTHYGVEGMKWGVRRYQPYGQGRSGRFLGKKPGKAKTKSKNVKTGGSTPDSEIASRTAKINQIKKSNGSVSKKDQKRIKRLDNDVRIIKEVQAHEKKTGDKGYTKRFMDSYDDFEMWDMSSPSELKDNTISNVGKPDKKPKTKKPFNTGKIDGKTLADEVIDNLGIVAVSSLTGGYLVSKGQVEVGALIGSMGGMYAAGSMLGDVIVRKL